MKLKGIYSASAAMALFTASFTVNPVKSATLKPLSNTGDGEKSFNETTHLINVGLSLGKNYSFSSVAYTTSVVTPNFNLSYEQPWPKRLGPGFLGVGAFVGYQSSNYRNTISAYYYEHHWNNIMVTGRAAYHWDVLNSKKAEVYAGTLIGLRAETYRYETNDAGPGGNAYRSSYGGGVSPVFSLFAGARWYFSKSVALFGEAGSGISYLTGGLTFKF
jgi:hypothetical protein